MKFGEYLLKKGKINKADLDVALQLQTEEGVNLEALAVEEGLLTEWQLDVILDRQKESGRDSSFVEIAIDMKFLNKEQIDELLRKQKSIYSLIGEILVLSGALSHDEKEEELKLFHYTKW